MPIHPRSKATQCLVRSVNIPLTSVMDAVNMDLFKYSRPKDEIVLLLLHALRDSRFQMWVLFHNDRTIKSRGSGLWTFESDGFKANVTSRFHF